MSRSLLARFGSFIFLAAASLPAQVDTRVFREVLHQRHPRIVSIYLKFLPDDVEVPRQVQVWDGLYLMVRPICGRYEGIAGYYFGFHHDAAGTSQYHPQGGYTIHDLLFAEHFRNQDNSGPNEVGPKNVNAPSELRELRYEGFSVEIRVLEFQILNATPEAIPSFGSLSCLVTVRETAPARPRDGV